MYDILIIGAGPAGITCAIYGARANLNVGIIEKEAPGGKVLKTDEIENYPGFDNVKGIDLASKMFEQCLKFGTEFLFGNVVKINNFDNYKEVILESGETYQSKTVVIATGNDVKKMNVPNEDKFYAKGISYCAVCDGALYKDKDMFVIGGGNSALQEALFLTKFAKKVYLVHRRDEFRAEKHLVDKVKNNPKIELLLSYVPVSINGEDHVTSITLLNKKTSQEEVFATNVVFPFIGFEPKTEFLQNLDILDDKGYVIVNDKMETKIKGIYSIGDVNSKPLRQITTAVSDGATAAIEAEHYIQNELK
ncbi:MAG: thioredoxin-disulfide reductase [Bacilli bacterium]|nr:thioredoxin-disulfide reductase [Bacilli bacterium]